MTGRTFVDTNILVYAEDPADPVKQLAARTVLRERADLLVLSAQVLSEFFTVVTRRIANPMSAADGERAVEQLSRHRVVAADRDLVLEGIRISRDARISFWDGLIVAAARVGGCESVLTEDLGSGSVISGIRIENPFHS